MTEVISEVPVTLKVIQTTDKFFRLEIVCGLCDAFNQSFVFYEPESTLPVDTEEAALRHYQETGHPVERILYLPIGMKTAPAFFNM